MLIVPADACQDDEAWTRGELGAFLYVPLAWRTGQSRISAGGGAECEIEEALKELHASYHDLPVPDRLLELVKRTQA